MIDQTAQPLGGDHFVVRPPAQGADVELLDDQIGRHHLAIGGKIKCSVQIGAPSVAPHRLPPRQQGGDETARVVGDQQVFPDADEAGRWARPFAQIALDQGDQAIAAEGQSLHIREEGLVIGAVLLERRRRDGLDQACPRPEQIDDDGGALADRLRQITQRQTIQPRIGDQGHGRRDNTVSLKRSR